MIFNLAFNKMQQEEDLFDSPSIYNNYTTTSLKWLPNNINLYDCNFYNCSYIYQGLFSGNSTITKVRFPKCSLVLSSTFNNCSQLSQVFFDNCETIGYNAFANCSKLESVSFPNVTTISTNAFYNCSMLSQLIVPECKKIESTAVHGTIINQFTYGLSSDYYSATGVWVNEYITNGLASITNQIASTLEKVDLPSCTTLSTRAFANCTHLSDIQIPVCQTIGNQAFSGCIGLSSITLPMVSTIAQSAFQNTSNLTDIYLLSNSVVNLIAEPSSTFYYSNSSYITTIHVPASLVSAYQSATNWALMSDKIVAIEEQE